MLLPQEIEETRTVTGVNVVTPDGLKAVTHVCRTIPMDILRLSAGGFVLEGSRHHLVGVAGEMFVHLGYLRPGDLVVTDAGLRSVDSVTPTGLRKNLYDLRVEGPDHCYFSNGILSHNSTGIGANALFRLNAIHRHSSLYIAPMKEHVKTFADKLALIEMSSAFPKTGKKGMRTNLYYKESKGGGALRLMHVADDVTKVRGGSYDHVDADECLLESTPIRLVGESKFIVDLLPGDVTVSFDEQNNVTTDKVVRIVRKGTRHVWRVTTADGSSVTCTGNERLRTSSGWRYLAEMQTDEENKRCARSQRAKAVSSGQTDGGGHNAWRCEPVDSVAPSALQSGPWTSSEGLLLGEGASAARVYSHPDAGSTEAGIRGFHGAVRYTDFPGVRLPDPSLLPEESGDRQAQEDRHPGVGGSADLGGGGLVVHGRREQDGRGSDNSDSLLLEGGGGPSCGLVDKSRVLRVLPKDSEGEIQNLLHTLHSDSVGCDLRGESQPIHPADYAVQAGDSRPSWAGVDLYVLRKRVLRKRSESGREGEVPTLQRRSVQEGGEGWSQRPLLREDGRHGCPVPAREVELGAQDARGAGIIEAPERRTEARETSSNDHREEVSASAPPTRTQEDPEGCRLGVSPNAQPHVHALSCGVLELGQRQDPEKLEAGLLRSARVPEPENSGGSENTSDCGSPEEIWEMIPVSIASIEYAGEQEVWDVETERYHTLFAGGIAVHNCQNMNPDLIFEIEMTMKDSEFASMNVAGTSLDKSTYLEQSYQAGSRGVWMIPDGGKKWWSLGDPKDIVQLMHVDGLKSPLTGRILNPLSGRFVHEEPRMVEMGKPSFHLPQIIVPAYARGKKWLELYRHYKNPHVTESQFMREVMGIPTEDGFQELTEADLKACCDPNLTFDMLQADIVSGRTRYAHVSTGCDWGGSDPKVTARMKRSYTVQTMLGVRPSGMMDCVFGRRFPSKDYREIGGEIVNAHVKFKGTLMSADNGGGNYYNVHIRDSGMIPLTSFICYNYSDNLKEFLQPIDHPSFNLYSLARTDSLTMLFETIKSRRIRFPRWEESSTFLNDLLNIVRNITSSETTGRKLTRYIRIANRADDFAHALNYALTTARVALQEPGIPDRHIITQLQQSASQVWSPATQDTAWTGYSDFGHFSG